MQALEPVGVENEDVDTPAPLYVGPATASRQVLTQTGVLESTSLSCQRVALADARTISLDGRGDAGLNIRPGCARDTLEDATGANVPAPSQAGVPDTLSW